MLQVNNLTFQHELDSKILVKNLSFVVNPGDKVAIIGEEGNGKSTLLRWLVNDPLIAGYIHAEGELINQFSKTLYLPQNIAAEELHKSLEKYFFGEEEVLKLNYQTLYQLAGQLGFDGERLTSSQLIGSLSGGEKVKIQLLKMLAEDPDLLLLDEPSNDLDIHTVKWLERFIKSSPITMLFISHDEMLLTETATKVIQLEMLHHKTVPSATVSNLSYKDYNEQRQQQFEKQMQVAKKQRSQHDKQMSNYRAIESSVHDAQNKISRQSPGEARLLKKKMHAVKSMGKRFEREKESFEDLPIKEDAILIKFSNTRPLPNSKVVLHLENEQVMRGNEVLIKGINLLIRGPRKIGIIGKNGVGKSTWLKQLWHDLRNRSDLHAGYMPQNYEEYLSPDETPIQFLSDTRKREELTQVMTYLGSMRFTKEEMNHSIRFLSGGQQAKLLLLKIDLMGQNVLLLDEPTRNFSPFSQKELRQLFQSFEGAIVTVSHDRLFLQEVCDEVYELTKNGLLRVE